MHYCYACGRSFHPLGIMRHRAMHRDRRERIKIREPDGGVYIWDFRRGGHSFVDVPGDDPDRSRGP